MEPEQKVLMVLLSILTIGLFVAASYGTVLLMQAVVSGH